MIKGCSMGNSQSRSLDFRRRRAVISTAPWLRAPLWMWYFESSKSTIFEGQHDLKSSVKRGKVNVDLEWFRNSRSHRLNSVLEKCEKSSKAEDIFSTKPLWFSTYGGAGLWVRMAVLRVSLQMRIDGGLLKIGALVLPVWLRFPCGQLSECTGSHGYTSRRGTLIQHVLLLLQQHLLAICREHVLSAIFKKCFFDLFLSIKRLEVLHSRGSLSWISLPSLHEPRAMVGEVRMVDPNAIIIFDLDSVEIIQQHALHEFDLRQFKEDILKL